MTEICQCLQYNIYVQNDFYDDGFEDIFIDSQLDFYLWLYYQVNLDVTPFLLGTKRKSAGIRPVVGKRIVELLQSGSDASSGQSMIRHFRHDGNI